MAKLTIKQQKFVNCRLQGMSLVASAVAAGYSRTSAAVRANELSKHPGVKAALRDGKDRAQAEVALGVKPASDLMPRDHYADSKDFLTDLMNHAGMPVAVRADAAKQLLPYQHAKLGEKGKKVSKGEEAHDAVTKGTRRPQPAPSVVPFRQRA
jgi:phage terminase small subunit